MIPGAVHRCDICLTAEKKKPEDLNYETVDEGCAISHYFPLN